MPLLATTRLLLNDTRAISWLLENRRNCGIRQRQGRRAWRGARKCSIAAYGGACK